jgi:hypothetical protein
MNGDLKKELKDELEREYFLIRKSKWWAFLGGAVAFLVAVGVVSRQSALTAVGSEAGKQALARIDQLKIDAEGKVASIKSNVEETTRVVTNIRTAEREAQAAVDSARVAASTLPKTVKQLADDIRGIKDNIVNTRGDLERRATEAGTLAERATSRLETVARQKAQAYSTLDRRNGGRIALGNPESQPQTLSCAPSAIAKITTGGGFFSAECAPAYVKPER